MFKKYFKNKFLLIFNNLMNAQLHDNQNILISSEYPVKFQTQNLSKNLRESLAPK